MHFDSPRIQTLRDQLIQMIPCMPEEARLDLRAMALPKLLGRYLNWADRFVAPRPRSVVTWDGFLKHGNPEPHWDVISDLAAKIEAGEELRPFLSGLIENWGYTPPKRDQNNKPRGVEWHDKDYALNAYEVHHLHLSTKIKPDGWSKRTHSLIYVNFSRNDAFFLMVGDHNSFDDGSLANAIAEARVGTTYELKGVRSSVQQLSAREQNQLQRRGLSTAFQAGGQTILGAFLSTAGTSPLHTMHAGRMVDLIENLDRQLDTPGFGREWFEEIEMPYPSSPEFEWAVQYCDLFLVERTTNVGFLILKWRR